MNPLHLFDSLRNLVSGLGTSKDPTTASHYHLHLLDRNQLESAYRANWVARRGVDAIPEDCTREWREWQAAQDQIEKIEETEKKFEIQKKTKLAMIRARLYGGAALVMGVDGGGEVWEPLDFDALGEGCLRFVVVLNRYELSAGPRIYDAESPWYTRPEYYQISTPMTGVVEPGVRDIGVTKIHPSRVIEFSGNDLPDWRLAPLGGGWGDSVLQTLDETLKDFGLTVGGVANMVNDAKVDVIKIPDLASKLSTDATTQKLFQRFQYANIGKSTLNALLIDSAEEWERVQTTFGGLADILREYMTLASGALGIPVSRLMGSAPGKGLSTAGGGESDLRNYYDDCTSKQKTQVGPSMAPLDNVVQIHSLGSIDPSVYYEWAPLYKPDPKQVADIAFSKAQATNLDVQMGLINEDALRRMRINQLIEDGTYPGIEDAIDEFGEEPEDPTPEEIAQQQAMMGRTAGPMQQAQGLPQQRPALLAPQRHPQFLDDAWSEEAREAAIAARRAHAKGPKDEPGKKRLGGVTAYHGASSTIIASVAKKGIVVGEDKNVWVAANKSTASFFAETRAKAGSFPVVFEVNIPREKWGAFHELKNGGGTGQSATGFSGPSNTASSTQKISPSWIVGYHKVDQKTGKMEAAVRPLTKDALVEESPSVTAYVVVEAPSDDKKIKDARPMQAAGVMYRTPQGSALFVRRAGRGDHAGEWCFPGGGVDGDETAQQAAQRESVEEVGYSPADLYPVHRTVSDEGVDYTTYRADLQHAFTPKLNHEHDQWTWASPDAPPEPLHPGVRKMLDDYGRHN